MRFQTLSTRDRRTIVVGGAAVASLILLAKGVPAWRAWIAESRARATEQMRMAADADVLLARAPAMRDTMAARNARYIALAPALVAGRTPAEASATLASLVSGAASAAGLKLGTVQLRAPADTGAHRAFVRVSVRADVVGDVHGLLAMLAGLERGPVRLRVRELTVTQPDATAPDDRIEELRADLTVEGLAMAKRQ
jgi:hypothetical protein